MDNHLHLPSTSSTMDVAAQMLREGAPHLTVITATEQTAARGRQGRMWSTFPGHGLAATWLLRGLPTQHLALVASLAVSDALAQATPGLNPVIKWPNDITLGGKKLAGILVETHGSGQNLGAALGIGLNITRSPAMRPDFPGTTLEDHLAPGRVPHSTDLLNILHTCLSARLALYGGQGWSAVAPDYTALCQTLNQKVRLQRPDGTVLPATVNALNPDGSLDVVTADGTHHAVTNADKLFHDYLQS
jgi:BirA family biotin operon repressor/biotin-[acetyl-CoA-carboxylase] ligase